MRFYNHLYKYKEIIIMRFYNPLYKYKKIDLYSI